MIWPAGTSSEKSGASSLVLSPYLPASVPAAAADMFSNTGVEV